MFLFALRLSDCPALRLKKGRAESPPFWGAYFGWKPSDGLNDVRACVLLPEVEVDRFLLVIRTAAERVEQRFLQLVDGGDFAVQIVQQTLAGVTDPPMRMSCTSKPCGLFSIIHCRRNAQ